MGGPLTTVKQEAGGVVSCSPGQQRPGRLAEVCGKGVKLQPALLLLPVAPNERCLEVEQLKKGPNGRWVWAPRPSQGAGRWGEAATVSVRPAAAGGLHSLADAWEDEPAQRPSRHALRRGPRDASGVHHAEKNMAVEDQEPPALG